MAIWAEGFAGDNQYNLTGNQAQSHSQSALQMRFNTMFINCTGAASDKSWGS